MAEVLNPQDAPQWYDFVTKFDATFKSFQENFDALRTLAPYIQTKHPELISQYNKMIASGNSNARKLSELKATRDYVVSWLDWLKSGASSVASFVSSAAQSAYDFAKRELGLSGAYDGLGFVPVAVAVVGAATAIAALVVIAKWITDAYMFAQRLNALQAQEAKGLTPAQAAHVVNTALGPPTSTSNGEFLGIPWTLLAWAAIVIVLAPPILKTVLGGDKSR